MKKLLTIVVPSYNMEKYLRRGLESLIVQDSLLEMLDVIVVNDGSKDRTSEIAHEFAEKYPRSFRVVDKSNGHYGSCVNVGLKMAVGAYVRILDADDSFNKPGLEHLLKFLDSIDIDDNDVVFFDTSVVYGNGEWTLSPPMRLPVNRVFSFDELPSPREVFWGQTRYAFKVEKLRQIGYLQTEGVPYSDAEWIAFPWSNITNMRYFPEVVSVVLVGRDGQTMNPKTYMRDFGIVVDLTRGMLRNLPVYTKNANKEQSSYVREKVLHMVDHVYETCLLCKPKADLRAFDEELRVSFPDFYGEGRCRIKLLFWRVDIVPFWRRHPHCCGCLVIMYRFQQFFRRPLGRIKRALIRTR